MAKKKIGPGGKLNRSEIVQARLDPKLRFAAELVSTYERRTVSSLIETALESYLKICRLDFATDEEVYSKVTVDEILELVWSPNEAIRFTKKGLVAPCFLTPKEEELWGFILDTKYFWAHYEATIFDPKGNVIRKEWWPYWDLKGIVEENLIKYWDDIKTKDRKQEINIPDEPGKKIKPPPGFQTEDVESYPNDITPESMVSEKNRYQIWCENVKTLVKQEFETVDTPDGKKTIMKIIYPTQEEQQKMVERLYKKQKK